jgi:hypothetical protein
MDIEQAKNLFKRWDLNHTWRNPPDDFIKHCKKKSEDSLNLAKYLLKKLEQTEELKDNDSTNMWIIAQSYYSMFFEVEYLLALDRKKLP